MIIQKIATQNFNDMYESLNETYDAEKICNNETKLTEEYSGNLTACKESVNSEKAIAEDKIRSEHLTILKEAGVQVTQVKCDNLNFKFLVS